MRKRRLFVVAFIVGAVSLGIPSQVSAAPSIPRSLTAVRTVLSQVDPGQSKTISVRMPWRANMVGVSYLDATHSENGVSVVARAHTVDGWSTWEELGGNDNGAMGVEAKHDSQRLSTEAVWVGTADHVEVKVSVANSAQAIQDVRVHLINTLGDSKPENIVVRALHAIGRFLSMRAAPAAAPAQARTIQPTIISRAQWGANPAYLNLPCPGVAPELKMAFVHHTDTTNSYTRSQSAGIVRGIYAYHTNTRGYCDIAYNFLIDKYGQIFEGRNGGITNNVIGAHTGGYNYESVGVALLGNYSTARPSSAMLTALTKLLAWRLDIAHVPPTGIVTMKTGEGNDHRAAGTLVNFNRISGHRDASLTTCPGSYVYNDLNWIRKTVRGIGNPKIYTPMLDTVVLRPDGDSKNEMIRFTASFSSTVTWTLSFVDPQGVVQRTLTGTGSAVKQYWGAQTALGALVASGQYTWKLVAHDATSHAATGASGILNVVTSHPDGTLLSDANGKYVIDNGVARAVDPIAYASNFGTLPAVPTGPNERARYASGPALGLRDGTLLADTTTSPAAYYMWSSGALHAFKDGSFTALGYQAAAAITATPTYLAGLTAGTDITSLTQHPDGTLLKSADGKSFWVIQTSTRQPISALARASLYRSNEAVTATAADLTLPLGTVVPVRNGALIKANDGGAPWIIGGGSKHRFVSTDFAAAMGFTSAMMLTGSTTDMNALSTGTRIG
ncbi:MAG TPA: peptidoglycan recognition protein [Actinomycetota bacterium]|nr:peptidoglycan recognition protein [Actinomycetota bacterium]